MSAQLTVRKAKELLKEKGPMHYKALHAALMAANAITPRGKDPEYTTYADCFFAVKHGDSELRMVGRGVYALAEHGDVNGAEYAPERGTSTSSSRPKGVILKEIVDGLTDEELKQVYVYVRNLAIDRGIVRGKNQTQNATEIKEEVAATA